MDCVEEVIESKPYGIDVSLLPLSIAMLVALPPPWPIVFSTLYIPHLCIFIYVPPVF
jgi:hypothetical protein